MLNDNLSRKFEQITGLNFSNFYAVYKPKLIWHLTKYTKDQEIAEDFADDAFTQALLKIDNFNAEKSQIHTWIYKIAENLVKKEYKDRKRLNVVSMDKQNDDNLNLTTVISNSLVYDDVKTEQDLILLKKVELVKEAIQRLPDKYKHVMVLREIENKTYLDIADICKKEYSIKLDDETLKLEDTPEFLSLELENNSSVSSYVIFTYKNHYDKEIVIEFEILPQTIFNINREEISNINDIEIYSIGSLIGVYKTTTNLSTIKSQISKGRQLIQSMVNKKFKLLDEHGLN